MIQLNYRDPRPIYEQVRDGFRQLIVSGVLEPDISSGRVEGNGNIARVFFTKQTKGGQNSDRYALGYAKAPVFSETDLYQTNAFRLTLTSGEGATIRYTTNGTEPTDSSKVPRTR